jgi:hypothetical protein
MRLLTIIAGTQSSAFGWLRMRKIQLTRPLLKMAETWLRLAEQAEGRESKKTD